MPRLYRYLRTLCLSVVLLALGVPASRAAHDVFWVLYDEDSVAGYLLGTIHSEDPRLLEYTDEFQAALTGCDRFAMELVPDLATLRAIAEYMRLPPGESLRALLGDDRFEKVARALSAYGVTEEEVDGMKPWAAMMTLSVPPPQTGIFMDLSLSLRAAGHGLRVIGLETLEEQLAFLEDMKTAQQMQLLDHAVAEFEQVHEVHDRMVDTYLTGSLSDLEELTSGEMESLDPVTREYFFAEGIDARNQRMVKNLLPELAKGCVFIAVGALHLPGDYGLLNLLRREGYVLERLPSPFRSSG